jgi:ABC-type nitrate/sulfonate/bicarbonate transport system substrate-binding protein
MRQGQRHACVVVGALACAFACERPRERLAVGYMRQAAAALIILASEEGFFRDERLDVTLQVFSSGRDAFRAEMEGRLDAAMVYTTPVLLQASSAPPPRILTMLHQSGLNTAVVARADRGIRTAQDLRGKTVGVPPGTNAEFFLRTLLEFASVGWNEVRVVDVRPEAIVETLTAGRVDAVAAWAPYCDRAARALPPGVAVTLRSDVYNDISMLVTRPEVVTSRRVALEAALRALVRAERLASSDPERLFAVVRRALPEAESTELREQLQRVQLRLGASHILVQNLRTEAEWFTRAGRLPRSPVDLRSLVVTDLLDAVAPELVTLEAEP